MPYPQCRPFRSFVIVMWCFAGLRNTTEARVASQPRGIANMNQVADVIGDIVAVELRRLRPEKIGVVDMGTLGTSASRWGSWTSLAIREKRSLTVT